jgi:hypothetical protein
MRLYLNNAQRQLLLEAMDAQQQDERDAFRSYFLRNQTTLRPKLERTGPVLPTSDETNYMLFTLGQIMATVKDSEKPVRRSLLKKLVEVSNGHQAQQPGTGR